MIVQNVSIDLSQQEYEFIEKYRIDHQLNNCSEVIKKGLELLQQEQLESYYSEANQEIDAAY